MGWFIVYRAVGRGFGGTIESLTVSKIWCSLDWPQGIITNSAGEIIVAEGEKNVTIIGKDGKRIGSIKAVDHHFQHLAGSPLFSRLYDYMAYIKRNVFEKIKNTHLLELRMV